MNPAKTFTNSDWMLSKSRTTPSERGDLVVLGTAKLRHRKSISWTTTRGRDVSKRIFERIHDRFQRGSVFRDSQLKIGWTEEKCIKMDKLAQEDHSYCPSSEEYSQLWTVCTVNLEKNDLNQFLFHQYQRWHSSSSSSSTSWWQWNENWWSS